MDVLVINKDLGPVPCGKDVSTIFELKNNNEGTATLSVVEGEADVNFEITPKTLTVKSGSSALFGVAFVLHVPGIIHNKVYTIYDGNDVVAKFGLRCESFGASVQQTLYHGTFWITRKSTVHMKRYKLLNLSTCPAKFQFEHNGNCHPFRITPEAGVIQSRGALIVDVHFVPCQYGVYNRQIFCLIQYHEPVIFDLVGVHNPDLKGNPNSLKFYRTFQRQTNNNYEAFIDNLNKVPKVEEVDPCLDPPKARPTNYNENEGEEENRSVRCEGPLQFAAGKSDPKSLPILSTYFLDIGNGSSVPHALKLINMSDTREFYFEWSNDNGKHLSIRPKRGNLRQGERVEMDIDFCPESRHRLYSGELDVRIFPLRGDEYTEPETILLPLTLTVTVTGHSFPSGSDGWLDQCEIEPGEIAFPACTPGEVLYASTVIKRHGHLPVMFRFIPPKRTSIKVKPPLGCITASHQIIVVQFDSTDLPEGVHKEEWKIACNTAENYYAKMIVTAHVENPAILVGNDNKCKFVPTLPGAMSQATVSIRNPTMLTLNYEFIVPQHITWFEIPVKEGMVQQASHTSMVVIFKPEKSAEYLDQISCRVRSAKRPNYVFSMKVQMEGSCQEGDLVATPSFHDFGRCLYGEKQTMTFHLYNFTPVAMNFLLFPKEEELVIEKERNALQIIPSKGFIRGKDNIQIEVELVPRVPHVSKVSIMCQLMATGEREDPLSQEARPIISLKVNCSLPKFQIIDINVEGSGPVITPDWLWKMMNIDRINKTLKTILPHEEEVVTLRLPDAPHGSPPMVIRLLLETRNRFPMSFQVRKVFRNHVCNDPSWTDSAGGGYNQIIFDPPKVTLEPVQQYVLNMAIYYETVGCTIYEWSLEISQFRLLDLKTTVFTMPYDTPMHTSTYLGPNLTLEPVFIGDLTPPVHLYWLYNNTPNVSCYIVDKNALRSSTPSFPKIFDCLNPNGILPPFSCLPVLFTFRPNEAKEYNATTDICLNSGTLMEINLTGKGVLSYSPLLEICHAPTVPAVPILKPTWIEIRPSVKLFTINLIPTFSEVRRIFFLENLSPDKVWAFHWHAFQVDNVISASVEPSDGKINPGEKIFQILLVTTFRFQMKTTFSIPCDVIDFTALETHENAIALQSKVLAECEDIFVITEKGMKPPEIPVVAVPEKPKMYHTFIAVNAHVTSGNTLQTKLYPWMELKQTCGQEVTDFLHSQTEMNEDGRQTVNMTMEKIIWIIINSPKFEKQFEKYRKEFGKATYLQVLPQREKIMADSRKCLRNSMQKSSIQSLLEDIIINILSKHS